MKNEMEKLFKELYEGKRILAIQLNGFSHKVFYDSGTTNSDVIIEEHSGYLSEYERTGRFTPKVQKLFDGIGHLSYQNNPVEIVYVNPEDR